MCPSRDPVVTACRHHLSWLVALAVAFCAMPAPASAQRAGLDSPRRLVVPFENASRTSRLYWLAEATAVLLTDDLTALGAGAISREDRVLAYEQLRVPVTATLSHATVIRIGQLVGATQIAVGSYTLTGETLTVRAQLIELASGRLLPEVSESAPLADLFGIVGRVARRLAPESTVSLEEMERAHPPLTAFEPYVKGLLAQSPTTRATFFQQSLRLAPTFQRARLGLWEVHTAQGAHAQALTVVRQVPSSDPLARRAQFLAARSMIELGQWATASETLTNLHRARPDAAVANNLGVIQLRRPAATASVKASTYFAAAISVDPTDADLYFNLGYARWLERDIPAAIDALREVVRRNPADGDAHYVLGVALQASGSPPEAARERTLARQLSSMYAEWEARPGGTTSVPRGRERLKTEIDIPQALRVVEAIGSSGQREQQEEALFHLESGKRLYLAERDAEAVAELRRAVYLAPYQSEAHLMLGRAYLRMGRVADAIAALTISVWSADTVVAHVVLAEAHLRERNWTAVRAEVQNILRRDPGNVEARGLLERIPPSN